MTQWDRPCYSSSLLQGRHAISYNMNHRTWKFKQNTRVWICANSNALAKKKYFLLFSSLPLVIAQSFEKACANYVFFSLWAQVFRFLWRFLLQHFRLQQLTKSIASLRFDTSSALGCLILICWTCKSYLRKRKEKSYERFDRNPGKSRAVKKGKRHGNVRPKNSRYRESVEDEENKSFSIWLKMQIHSQ